MNGSNTISPEDGTVMFGHYLRLNNRVLYCMALWIGAIFRWWGILRVVSEMPTQEVHRILACISESRPTRPSIPYALPDAKFCFGGSPRNLVIALGEVCGIALGDAFQKRFGVQCRDCVSRPKTASSAPIG